MDKFYLTITKLINGVIENDLYEGDYAADMEVENQNSVIKYFNNSLFVEDNEKLNLLFDYMIQCNYINNVLIMDSDPIDYLKSSLPGIKLTKLN